MADEHTDQLHRYFAETKARIAILTNGIQYQLYSDLDEPNVMDDKSFLDFSILDIQEQDSILTELKRLTKSSFDVEDMLSAASGLKYTKEIRKNSN